MAGEKIDLRCRATGTDPETPEDEQRRRTVAFLSVKARVASEEQGVQILYLACGWLNWFDERRREDVRSPLVLTPMAISADQKSIQLVDDDVPDVNPALAELLRADHHIVLPRVDSDAASETQLERVLESVRAAVSARTTWTVESGSAILDVFSFRKIALFHEIERSVQRLWAHPLVRAFSGDGTLLEGVPPLPVYQDLDKELPPSSVRTVVPADSSQLRAVAAARTGGSLVIQGPPGTGKSQTITNLVGEFLAQGKTVLFVAEKAVARQVVHDNLTHAGVGSACLHLRADVNSGRGSSAAKADALQELKSAYDQGRAEQQVDPRVADDVSRTRGQLNDLASAVHRPAGPGEWATAYRAVGESLWAGTPLTFLGELPSIHDLSVEGLEDAFEALVQLEDLGQNVLRLHGSVLDELAQPPDSPDSVEALRRALSFLSHLPSLAEALIGTVMGPADKPPADWTPAALRGLRADMVAVARFQRLSGARLRWLRPPFYSARAAAQAFTRLGRPVLGLQTTDLGEALDEAERAIRVLYEARGGRPVDSSLAEFSAVAGALLAAFGSLPELLTLRARLAALEPYGLRGLAQHCLSSRPGSSVAHVAKAALWYHWADELVRDLSQIAPEAHERLIERFKSASEQLSVQSQRQALNGACARRPDQREYVPP